MITPSFIFMNATKLSLVGSPSRPASEMVKGSMRTLADPAGGRLRGQAVGVPAPQRGALGHTLSGPGLASSKTK